MKKHLHNSSDGMIKNGKISWDWIKKETERKQVALKLEDEHPLLYKYLASKAGKTALLIAIIIGAFRFFFKSASDAAFDYTLELLRLAF